VLERPAAPAALELALQSDADAARARTAVLPPLLSVVELTTAFRPPERNVEVQVGGGQELLRVMSCVDLLAWQLVAVPARERCMAG
jgi:hypothetical protein